MTEPYYSDEQVTLYLGDCLEVTAWLEADVLVTDPPYGINWIQPSYSFVQGGNTYSTRRDDGIRNDVDASVRDAALQRMKGKPQVVFGSPLTPPPRGTKQVLVWKKPLNSGLFGCVGGFRRDIESIYLIGPWKKSGPDRSSVLVSVGSVNQAGFTGHPHSKPIGLLENLIAACPAGIVADPFAGSGSTLIAARNQGRRAIGVEIEERYCELIATRLSQACFDFGEGA